MNCCSFDISYLNVIITLIAICPALTIAIEIFNENKIKRRIKKLKETQKTIENQLEVQKLVSLEGLSLIESVLALNTADSRSNSLEAFLPMHKALVYSVKLGDNSQRQILLLLEKMIDDLGVKSFDDNDFIGISHLPSVKKNIDCFLNYVEQDEDEMRLEKKFLSIKKEYTTMRKKLDDKLDEILNNYSPSN